MVQCPTCLAKLFSLKCLLILSFILLMVISGFLGFVLTYVQSQKSMHEIAEHSIEDLISGVISTISNQFRDGHQMNLHEVFYFRSQNLYLNDWVTIWNVWRPFTLQALKTVSSSYLSASLAWLPNYAILYQLRTMSLLLLNFNGTVCNDTVHFPGSNCSLTGGESYRLAPDTYEPDWTKPLRLNVPYKNSDQVYWKTGVYSRLAKWQANPGNNPNNLGYADIAPFYEVTPPSLNIQVQAPIYAPDGSVVGQTTKALVLQFVGVYLNKLVASHTLLNNSGRAFSFELRNGFLTGVSHGNISRLNETNNLMIRFTPVQCPDHIISEAGKALVPFLTGATSPSVKVQFSTLGKDFLCIAQPLVDDYGLAWMAAVVLSETDLFSEMNSQAMKMLGFTALAIILLSIFAGLAISVLVGRSLNQLSKQMAKVADMNLDDVKLKQSFFYEVSTMQRYFYAMVDELKDFRAFLPQAILNDQAGVGSSTGLDEKASLMTNSNRVTILSDQQQPARRMSSFLRRHPQAITPVQPPVKSTPIPSSEVTSANELARVDTAGSSSFTQSPKLQPLTAANRQLGPISKRMVSMLFADFDGFHAMMERMSTEQCMSVHGRLIDRIYQIVSANYGMGAPIMGDKVMAFWNIRNVKADHALSCAKAALQIFEEFRKPSFQLKSPKAPPADEHTCYVRVSCAAGTASFGTMGTISARSFLVLSPMIARAALIQKLSKLIPFGVCCDGIMFELICQRVFCRLVCFTRFPDRGAAENLVYEMLDTTAEASADLSTANNESNPKVKWVFDGMKQGLFGGGTVDNQNSDPLSIRAVFDPSQTTNIPNSEAQVGVSAAAASSASALVASWYHDHSAEVRALIHPTWGLTVPTHILLSNAGPGADDVAAFGTNP